jgi:hypothetical protein
MSFPFHLPKELGQTRRYDATNTLGWQTYTVPAGASLLHVIAVSGGGGGGAGFGAAAASARPHRGLWPASRCRAVCCPERFICLSVWAE